MCQVILSQLLLNCYLIESNSHFPIQTKCNISILSSKQKNSTHMTINTADTCYFSIYCWKIQIRKKKTVQTQSTKQKDKYTPVCIRQQTCTTCLNDQMEQHDLKQCSLFMIEAFAQHLCLKVKIPNEVTNGQVSKFG